jgi:hypothetical protein
VAARRAWIDDLAARICKGFRVEPLHPAVLRGKHYPFFNILGEPLPPPRLLIARRLNIDVFVRAYDRALFR